MRLKWSQAESSSSAWDLGGLVQSTNLQSEPLWYSEDLPAEILLPQGRRANLCDLSSCCNATASPGPSFPFGQHIILFFWLSPLCRDLVCTILQKTLTAPPSPGWVCISCTTPAYFDMKGSISSLSMETFKVLWLIPQEGRRKPTREKSSLTRGAFTAKSKGSV